MYLHYSYDDDVRVIIIHPNYAAQHLLLIDFIQHTGYAYVCCVDERDEQSAWQLIQDRLDNFSPQAEPEFLILDECDRLATEMLDKFIVALLNQLQSTKLVILSRNLPDVVRDNPKIRRVTQLVPVDRALRLYNLVEEHDKPCLIVHGFGEGRAYLNGKEITEWSGPLARHLFFFLIDNSTITRDEIFDTFWLNVPRDKAANAFHVTKRGINELLGFKLIEFARGYYRLTNEMTVIYDVEEFYQLSQDGMFEEDETKLMMAHQLFRYTFMQSAEETTWVVSRRDELNLHYTDAMNTLVQLKLEAGESDVALGIAIRILSLNRMREDIAARIMRLYLERKQPEEALKIYKFVVNYIEQSQTYTPNPALESLKTQAQNQNQMDD